MRGMNNMQANICLLAVTLCWSCEVVLLALVPKEVNPFATNCTTSLIAALLLGACFYRRIVATFKRDGFVLQTSRKPFMIREVNQRGVWFCFFEMDRIWREEIHSEKMSFSLIV